MQTDQVQTDWLPDGSLMFCHSRPGSDRSYTDTERIHAGVVSYAGVMPSTISQFASNSTALCVEGVNAAVTR